MRAAPVDASGEAVTTYHRDHPLRYRRLSEPLSASQRDPVAEQSTALLEDAPAEIGYHGEDEAGGDAW